MRAVPSTLGAALVAALLALGVLALPAGAHPMATSAVLLDVSSHQVSGDIELPLDRLAVAVGHPISTAQATGSQRAQLQAYVARHVSASGTDGRAWTTRLGRATVREIQGRPNLVVPVRFTPPAGVKVGDFHLHYDVIINQLVTHRAFVVVRSDFAKGQLGGGGHTAGILDWNHHDLAIRAGGGSWLQGVAASARLGVQHVSTGSDHLLFLLTLLLPAPLVARRRRWRPGPSDRRSAVRVVHVVSAFAVGHSTTLILAGLGVIHLPERPIEFLIALSIAVSALHAIRPLVRGGEAIIALTFGLVHGVSFASALGELGLTRGSLVSSLLGFNAGIELTQLFVVALIMPSLLILARTAWYTPLRVGIGAAGVVFAGSWMLERSTLIASDPFLPFTEWLVANPFLVAAAFALLALVARGVAPDAHDAALPATSVATA